MVNKVIIIGNVGADPEVRVLDGGNKVASLSVATTERYTDRQTNTPKEITEWHHVVAWRNTADIVDKYVKKGSPALCRRPASHPRLYRSGWRQAVHYRDYGRYGQDAGKGIGPQRKPIFRAGACAWL